MAGPRCAPPPSGGRILYVAARGARSPPRGADARLRSLARAAYAPRTGRRRFDACAERRPSRGASSHARGLRRARAAPPLPRGLDDGRAQRRAPARARCANGRDGSHRTGRAARCPAHGARGLPLRGERHGRRPRSAAPRRARPARGRRELRSGRRLRLGAARATPRAAACSCSASSAQSAARWPRAIRAELLRSRHDVQLHTRARRAARQVREPQPPARASTRRRTRLAAGLDDDIELPRGFLDRFLFLAERFSLASPSPRTGCTPTPRGRVTAAERERRARDRLRRDRPGDRLRARDLR